jgi:hypothetical protein
VHAELELPSLGAVVVVDEDAARQRVVDVAAAGRVDGAHAQRP